MKTTDITIITGYGARDVYVEGECIDYPESGLFQMEIVEAVKPIIDDYVKSKTPITIRTASLDLLCLLMMEAESREVAKEVRLILADRDGSWHEADMDQVLSAFNEIHRYVMKSPANVNDSPSA